MVKKIFAFRTRRIKNGKDTYHTIKFRNWQWSGRSQAQCPNVQFSLGTYEKIYRYSTIETNLPTRWSGQNFLWSFQRVVYIALYTIPFVKVYRITPGYHGTVFNFQTVKFKPIYRFQWDLNIFHDLGRAKYRNHRVLSVKKNLPLASIFTVYRVLLYYLWTKNIEDGTHCCIYVYRER